MNVRFPVVFLVGAALALLVTTTASAAPEDVEVGATRAVVTRAGTPLRQRPSALAPAAATLPYGTRVTIEEVGGGSVPWIRVTVAPGQANVTGTGWLRANQTVQPMALTMGGQRGAIAAGQGASTDDISAAGRQFDAGAEDSYRKTNPNLARYYPMVKAVEEAQPMPSTVESFILAGGLGRPGEARQATPPPPAVAVPVMPPSEAGSAEEEETSDGDDR